MSSAGLWLSCDMSHILIGQIVLGWWPKKYKGGLCTVYADYCQESSEWVKVWKVREQKFLIMGNFCSNFLLFDELNLVKY